MTATAILIESADEIAALLAPLIGERVTIQSFTRDDQRVDSETGAIVHHPIFHGRTGYLDRVEQVGLAGVAASIEGSSVYLYGDHPFIAARPFRVTIH